MKRERFKFSFSTLRSLRDDPKREAVYFAAHIIEAAGVILGQDPDLYRLLAKALEGKFEPKPTPTHINIIKAYIAARNARRRPLKRDGGGISFDALVEPTAEEDLPTLKEWEIQWKRLFDLDPPTLKSVKCVLNSDGLPWRGKGKPGRPRNR